MRLEESGLILQINPNIYTKILISPKKVFYKKCKTLDKVKI